MWQGRRKEGEKGGQQENTGGENLGVRGDNGGREASRVAENPQGSCQGVGRGVKSPQGNNTPGVTELPQEDKNPRVTTEGEGVLGEDGRGWGGDGTPPHHPSN